MSGFFTAGVEPALTDAQVQTFSTTARVPVDTGATNGVQPASAGLTLGQVGNYARPNGIVTAHAGGTKAAAQAVLYGITGVTVVATAADSILLPPALPGALVYLSNSGVASMQVFGASADVINGIATGTGVAQANGVSALYFCTVAGFWFRILSA